MIEITESMPYYICNKERLCSIEGGCGEDMCNHTTYPLYAKNDDAIGIFEEFTRRFDLSVDEMGRLICMEKEEEMR